MLMLLLQQQQLLLRACVRARLLASLRDRHHVSADLQHGADPVVENGVPSSSF
jgi:hypothetical protein